MSRVHGRADEEEKEEEEEEEEEEDDDASGAASDLAGCFSHRQPSSIHPVAVVHLHRLGRLVAPRRALLAAATTPAASPLLPFPSPRRLRRLHARELGDVPLRERQREILQGRSIQSDAGVEFKGVSWS